MVVTIGETRRYHCGLWNHPAASPYIHINYDPISYIRMLLTGNKDKDVAEKILERRKLQKFTSFDEVKGFVAVQNLQSEFIPDAEERISFE